MTIQFSFAYDYADEGPLPGDADFKDPPCDVAFSRGTRIDGLCEYAEVMETDACKEGFFVGPGDAPEVVRLLRRGIASELEARVRRINERLHGKSPLQSGASDEPC